MTETESPKLEHVIRRIADAQVGELRVSLPGKVLKYDASTQKADIQILIKDGFLDESGERQTVDIKPLTSVPVMFPGAGDRYIAWAVEPGDLCLLVFSSSSIDVWLNEGSLNPTDPRTDHRHRLDDAVAIMGMRSFKNPLDGAPTSGIVVNSDDIKLGSDTAADRPVLLSEFTTFVNAYKLHFHGAMGANPPNNAGTVTPGNGAQKVRVE